MQTYKPGRVYIFIRGGGGGGVGAACPACFVSFYTFQILHAQIAMAAGRSIRSKGMYGRHNCPAATPRKPGFAGAGFEANFDRAASRCCKQRTSPRRDRTRCLGSPGNSRVRRTPLRNRYTIARSSKNGPVRREAVVRIYIDIERARGVLT